MLFTELPFLDRFAGAASSGFRAVEFLFPYDFEVGALREALGRAQLKLDLFNLPAGNWAGGERGTAVLPERRAEFRRGLEAALRYAAALETRKLNCLVGLRDAQIAGSPERGEPGTGELAYPRILGELDELGYSGRVGLEYRPTVPTIESFTWVAEYGWRIDV